MTLPQSYQTFRKFRYFYSCIASVIALNAVVLASWVYLSKDYPDGLPDYSNAMVNLFYRLPGWLVGTFALACLAVTISEWHKPLRLKVRLLVINTLNWIVFQMLAFFVYWLSLPYNFIERAFLCPAAFFARLLRL